MKTRIVNYSDVKWAIQLSSVMIRSNELMNRKNLANLVNYRKLANSPGSWVESLFVKR